jgi:hypothetical protein
MRAEEDFLTWGQLEQLLERLERACAMLDQQLIREVLSEAIGGFVSKEEVSDPMLEHHAKINHMLQPTKQQPDEKVTHLFRHRD